MQSCDSSGTIVVLTATAKFPERVALLKHTIRRAASQQLRSSDCEILVLDDEGAHGWGAVRAAFGAPSGVRCRYVAVPGRGGKVNMRLKRNLAFELCTTDWLVFFDDDDWRSAEVVPSLSPSLFLARPYSSAPFLFLLAAQAVQSQLDALSDSGADICTVQLQHVCELDTLALQVNTAQTGRAKGSGV